MAGPKPHLMANLDGLSDSATVAINERSDALRDQWLDAVDARGISSAPAIKLPPCGGRDRANSRLVDLRVGAGGDPVRDNADLDI